MTTPAETAKRPQQQPPPPPPPPPPRQTALCVNIGAHAAAWTLTWAVALSRGNYARALAYVACVALLRVPMAFGCARLARHVTENAKLALVGVVCGGALTGAFLCMDGAGVLDGGGGGSGGSGGGSGATTALLVTLSAFDPMALLVVFAAQDCLRTRIRADTQSLSVATEASVAVRNGEGVFADAQSARVLGTLLGAALFTGTWISTGSGDGGGVGVAQLAAGALLLGAQVPLLPLDLGRATCAGVRIATVELSETDRTARFIRALPLAIAIDAAVALSLSVAVATWSYQALALWDTLYPGVAAAWAANGASFAVLCVAVGVARTRAMGLDAPLLSLPQRQGQPQQLQGQQGQQGQSPRQPQQYLGLSDASIARLRWRLRAHALVLACAVGASAVLDISLRFETPLHAAISLAVACAAVQVDQLAVQVATRANWRIGGTWVQVALFHALASVRAVLWATGFVLGWYWRERLRVSAIYALPFAAVAYALQSLQ